MKIHLPQRAQRIKRLKTKKNKEELRRGAVPAPPGVTAIIAIGVEL